MKNRLNLYLLDMQPRQELLTLNKCLLLGLLLLVIVLLLRLQQHWQLTHLQQQQQGLEQTLAEKTTLVTAMQQQLHNRIEDPKLVKKVNQLQQELRVKQQLLGEVQGREKLKTQGFAALMLDLARSASPQLWLREIAVDRHNIKFAGQANHSESLPKWLEALGNTEYFQGREFAAARLYRQEQQLHFVISSKLKDVNTSEVAND